MTNQNLAQLKLDGLLLLAIIILSGVVLLPVYLNFSSYSFLISNIISVAFFLIALRYIFLFRHSIFSHSMPFKLIMMILSIPIILYFLDGLNTFLRYCDEEGLQQLLKEDKSTNYGILPFIKGQYVFFLVTSLLLSIVFPIRMIVSIWRVKNRNTV